MTGKTGKLKKLTPEQIAAKRRKIWTMIAKKEIPKASVKAVSTCVISSRNMNIFN